MILETALGKRKKLTIFGDDYPTPDGTCIRDYVHVEDLADAHVVAMNLLKPGFNAYNLGVGRGYSVREIFTAAEEVLGKALPVEVGQRRPGDPAALYADASKIARELGWSAKRTDVGEMIRSAWRWHEAHPEGYRSKGRG